MQLLKEALIVPAVLALPYRSRRVALGTNACNVQIGCVLLQHQPDRIVGPDGKWSESLTDAELKYGETHQECLAIELLGLLL